MARRAIRSNSVATCASRDWRDPGDEWVKTVDGWEKIKIVQCTQRSADYSDNLKHNEEKENEDPRKEKEKRNTVIKTKFKENEESGENETEREKESEGKREVDQSNEIERRERSSSMSETQPYCHITLKCTREIAGFNGLSEAMKRLDFQHAVRDQRRFHYVCKLLDLLITKKLATLTGGAQKMLFVMLEEVAHEVRESGSNLHILHALIQELQKRLEDYLNWGNKLGSSLLWKQHSQRLEHISTLASNIKIQPPDDSVHPTMQEVPEEVIREILLRLDNHRDLMAAGEAYSVMARVISEQSIWRQLCKFHWTWPQIQYMIRTHKELQVKRDWQLIYHKLRKSYGLKENYAHSLFLCKNCQCLYWQTFGHPCIVEDNPDIKERLKEAQNDTTETVKVIPPKTFLSFFSV